MYTIKRKTIGASKKLIYLALDLFSFLAYVIMEQLYCLTWAGSLRVVWLGISALSIYKIQRKTNGASDNLNYFLPTINLIILFSCDRVEA